MTDDEIKHGIVVIAERLERLESHTKEELLRLAVNIQMELLVIADNMTVRSHTSDYAHNDPSYEMSDEEYADNMLDLIEWELEAARDSAINGESNEDRHRHILDALDTVQLLTDKTPYIPQPHDPTCPF